MDMKIEKNGLRCGMCRFIKLVVGYCFERNCDIRYYHCCLFVADLEKSNRCSACIKQFGE